MSIYRVPVYWQVVGYIDIEADSDDEALEYVQDNANDYPLPEEEYYLEDSFEVGDTAYLLTQ